jgi:arylsulfatase A-like enzyme
VAKANSSSDVAISSTDFYPTILDLVHALPHPEQHVDGVSFAPLVRGESFERGKPIYWHYPHFGNQGGHPAAAILDGDLKLIEDLRDHHIELYDLKSDIAEQHDLAKTSEADAQRLLGKLHAWQKDVNAQYPKAVDAPQ